MSNTLPIPRPCFDGTQIFFGFQFCHSPSILGAVGSYAGLSTHWPPEMLYSYCFGCVLANLWNLVSPLSRWKPKPQNIHRFFGILCISGYILDFRSGLLADNCFRIHLYLLFHRKQRQYRHCFQRCKQEYLALSRSSVVGLLGSYFQMHCNRAGAMPAFLHGFLLPGYRELDKSRSCADEFSLGFSSS